jgi:hypothetical protein
MLTGSWNVALQGLTLLLLTAVSNFATTVLPARLILSVREFHSRIVGAHIDTGFGAISLHLTTINENDIVFSSPEVPMEDLGDHHGAEETSGGV